MGDTIKKNINVTSIPEDAEITITIGGTFYQRLNKLLIDFGDSVSEKELINAMHLIQRDKTIGNHYAFNLETLMILLRDIEQVFKDKGLTVENEIEIEVPKDFKEMKINVPKNNKD